MSPRKKPLLQPVLFMMAVTALCTLLLALLNEASIGRIREQESLQQKKTILYVLNQPIPEEPEAVAEAFSRLVVPENDYFKAVQGNETLGYAFPVEGPGLWGSMTGYAALDAEGKQLLGVSLPTHSETPGLGGRINEPWFTEQFRGIPLDDTGRLKLVFKPAEGGNLDAITGATLTSEAVRKVVTEDVDSFAAQLKGGGIQ